MAGCNPAPGARVAGGRAAASGSVAGHWRVHLTRGSGDPSSAEQPPPEFVTAAGRGLVLEGQPTRLKAVNFSNNYHRDQDGAELLNSQHHSEADFSA